VLKLQNALRNLEAQRKQCYVAPYELALIHAGARDNARAMDDLENAYADKSLSAQSLLFDPRLRLGCSIQLWTGGWDDADDLRDGCSRRADRAITVQTRLSLDSATGTPRASQRSTSNPGDN